MSQGRTEIEAARNELRAAASVLDRIEEEQLRYEKAANKLRLMGENPFRGKLEAPEQTETALVRAKHTYHKAEEHLIAKIMAGTGSLDKEIETLRKATEALLLAGQNPRSQETFTDADITAMIAAANYIKKRFPKADRVPARVLLNAKLLPKPIWPLGALLQADPAAISSGCAADAELLFVANPADKALPQLWGVSSFMEARNPFGTGKHWIVDHLGLQGLEYPNWINGIVSFVTQITVQTSGVFHLHMRSECEMQPGENDFWTEPDHQGLSPSYQPAAHWRMTYYHGVRAMVLQPQFKLLFSTTDRGVPVFHQIFNEFAGGISFVPLDGNVTVPGPQGGIGAAETVVEAQHPEIASFMGPATIQIVESAFHFLRIVEGGSLKRNSVLVRNMSGEFRPLCWEITKE